MQKRTKNTFLLRLLRPFRLRILGLSLLMVVQSVLQVSVALLMRTVIDTALAGGKLGLWAALLIADLLAQVGMHTLISWGMGSTADRLTADLRGKLLKRAVYSTDAQLYAYHSGALLSRGMEDVHTVCDGVIQAMPSLVGQLTRLAAAFVAVMLINPPVAGVLLAAGVVTILAISLMRPALRAHHRKVRQADENVMSTMQEDLRQLELIQSLRAQEPILARFRTSLKESLFAKRRRRFWSVGSGGILSILSLLGTGVLLLWGANRVAAGFLTYGALTALLQLISQFRTPVLSLSGLWTRFTAVEVAGERLALLMEATGKKAEPLDVCPKAVVFENVTFHYPDDDGAVVENFSLRLPLEGWISLSGISGRGKTTLFKLILGLYTPQSGRVYLETDQGQIPCSDATRHLFGYVPQDYALFSGTVQENLQLVAPDASQAQRLHALQIADADFVLDLPQGEQTHVGENNTGLSKGQLQRIAIARAVLMKPKVLLLDECTSALDGQTEKRVLENLKATGVAALLVTHRPEALDQLPDVRSVFMEK